MKTTLFQKYGAHFLAYIMSGLTLLLSYAHSCGASLPASFGRVAGVLGIVLAGLHQIQTFLRTPDALPAPAPTVNRESGRIELRLLGAVVAMTAAVLVGCAALHSAITNPASASAVQAAIDLAVGTTIQSTAHTPAEQAAQAQQIVTVAQEVESTVSGNTTTLALLDASLQQAIAAANLAPPDKAAALILAQTVQSIVLQQIQGAPGSAPTLTAAQTVAIKTVLNDVIQAASFYNVHAMAAMRADMAAEHARAQAQEDELANANPVGLEASRTVSDRMERAGAVLTRINRREIALNTP